MKTHEVTGEKMLSLMRQSGGVLKRWDGGFWCLADQPAGFSFGASPECPWIGSVMLQQMLDAGALTSSGDGYNLR